MSHSIFPGRIFSLNDLSVVAAAALLVAFAACGGADATGNQSSVPKEISLEPNVTVSAAAGSSVNVAVSVKDQLGKGVGGVTVTLAVSAGGGTVTPATVTSAADGKLPGVVWILGKSAVPQELTATGGGVTSTIAGSIDTHYPLDLRLFGPPLSAPAQQAFADAAARIRGMIVGTLSPITFPDTLNAHTACGGPDVASIGSTLGIIIYASVDTIDGPAKVLAQSGPCFIRNSSALPVLAVMKFDKDDIANLVTTGRLSGVVLHEMLHAVGVGTIWTIKGALSGGGTADPQFTGTQGISGCKDAGGFAACQTGIPVENCVGIENCGAGSQDSHWRESIFDSELMTGFVEAQGAPMPLSKMTILSLADLGYNVNSLSADPYVVPPPSIFASPQINTIVNKTTPAWEKMTTPRFLISPNLSITRLTQ